MGRSHGRLHTSFGENRPEPSRHPFIVANERKRVSSVSAAWKAAINSNCNSCSVFPLCNSTAAYCHVQANCEHMPSDARGGGGGGGGAGGGWRVGKSEWVMAIHRTLAVRTRSSSVRAWMASCRSNCDSMSSIE